MLLDEDMKYLLRNRNIRKLSSKGYYGFNIAGKQYVLHRFVYEKTHGLIPKGYDIHHINGDKSDNRIQNLQLIDHKYHGKLSAFRHLKRQDPYPMGIPLGMGPLYKRFYNLPLLLR